MCQVKYLFKKKQNKVEVHAINTKKVKLYYALHIALAPQFT